jgi:hypothetical protein
VNVKSVQTPSSLFNTLAGVKGVVQSKVVQTYIKPVSVPTKACEGRHECIRHQHIRKAVKLFARK